MTSAARIRRVALVALIRRVVRVALLALWISTGVAFAQEEAADTTGTPEAAEEAPTSTPEATSTAAGPTRTQEATAAGADSQEAQDHLPENHSPRGAVWRAAAVPGWGQLYNRQYYKMPIVWAGLGGIAGTALYVNSRYLVYRHAFHWIRRDQVSFDVPPSYEEDYLQLLRQIGLSPDEADARRSELGSLFQRQRDNLRRNRDLLYIGVGLFYGLTILDAYVNAHLLDFDVSEDLTLSLQPSPGGFSARISARW